MIRLARTFFRPRAFAILFAAIGVGGLTMPPPVLAQQSKKADKGKADKAKTAEKNAEKDKGKEKPSSGGPTLLASFGEWGAYAAASGKAKTCYALGKPKERLPASLKRDPGYIFISNRPGESVRNEVSIVMGFDVKPDSTPHAEIGANTFEMAPKGANLWVKNAAQENQFVDALRKGKSLIVKATSKKGNPTTDTYVLTGIQPAIERIGKECQ